MTLYIKALTCKPVPEAQYCHVMCLLCINTFIRKIEEVVHITIITLFGIYDIKMLRVLADAQYIGKKNGEKDNIA